ncbi:hypothetical protein [Bremerella sp. P1]|uniref:hypothetical protein n=1 Tax=Bremerella sp. P1 TaxID=3026424 RepID=UPI0023687B33|nr:hypothetical protein [Bremerella sp. P1]WDI43715.1 hypothetical protein PSR63_07115 [Bremerella sp. P1]
MLRANISHEEAKQLLGQPDKDSITGAFIGEVNGQRALITVGVWEPTTFDTEVPEGSHFVRAEVLHHNQQSAAGLPEAGARQAILDPLDWEVVDS